MSYSCQNRGKIKDETSVMKIEQMGLRYDEYEFAKQAEEGNIENVLLFLKAGMNPNAGFKAENPLARAIINGHYEVVKILLDHKADPDVGRHQNGITPLMYAAEYGHADIARLLIEHGADIHKRQDKFTGGFNALMYAAANGHNDIIDLLLSEGADINQKARNTRTTALHRAAFNKQIKTVSYLLKRGADKSLKDKKGMTPAAMVREEMEDSYDAAEYREILNMLED